MDPVAVAERLADELLFPAALATDAADAVPVELLDALADAGLYGLAGPVEAGGLDADLATTCRVIEALAGGCLTTAFVWGQHLGAVHAVALGGSEPLRERWLAPLCRGETRAGLALGIATLAARRDRDGWLLDGRVPWLSGWGRVDLVHTAARTDDGRVVWSLVDAAASETIAVEPLDLAALRATATVQASFRGHHVADERVTGIASLAEGPTPPEVLRIHASFSLGVASRCCRLLGPGPLDDELEAARGALDSAHAESMPAARAAAAELALRAASAALLAEGSGGLLHDRHGQRLAREALFLLVYAARPPVKAALLRRLGAGPDGPAAA